jgi:hypothetical protein
MGCLVAGSGGCEGDPVAAHVIARGMGGAKGGRRHLVGLCWHHHNEAGERPGMAHQDDPTTARAIFEKRHGVDLQAEAARVAAELDTRGIE